MKLISLIIPILLFMSCVQNARLIKEKGAKKARTEYYVSKKDKGIKHGIYKRYNTNGALIEVGNYSNDKRDGNWTFYDIDGKISKVYFYQNDTLFKKTQYKNNIIESVSTYEMGEIKFDYKYEENGKIKSHNIYESGRLIRTEEEDEIIEYHEKGKVVIKYDKLTGEKTDVEIKTPSINNYPTIARENGIEGEVVLKILSKGDCESIKTEFVESHKHKPFNDEALLTVKKYIALIKKYDPKRCINLEETIPIIFNLGG